MLGSWLVMAAPQPMPLGFWNNQNRRNITVSHDYDDLLIKVDKENAQPIGALKEFKKFPQGRLAFTGKVESEVSGGALLQVKLFKGDKLLSTVKSSKLAENSGTLAVEFDSTGADLIQVICTVDCSAKYVGTSTRFRNLMLATATELAQAIPTLKLIPGYEVCSIELNSREATRRENFHSEVYFREDGASEWIPALPLVYSSRDKRACGSLFTLKENTAYQLKLAIDDNGKKSTIEQNFRTRSSQVPVAKTIELTANTKLPLLIHESGKPDGYIRYVTKPGVTLNGGSDADEVIRIEDAQYVILDGLTIRGGKINAIVLEDASHIQILNCDISNYGRAGVRRPELDGKYYLGDKSIDHDTGILIRTSHDILIERNYFHDPRGTGSSWFYSHPAGPSAILTGGAEQTTIRYNDFVGSDRHRWSDAVEGLCNFSVEGSLCRNAEIIGNYFAFGDDDGIELDGGQQNCRFMFNKSEGFLCAVSTAPCIIGPSYIIGNLLCDPGDELGVSANALKNTYHFTGYGLLHFIHNTIVGEQSAMSNFGGRSLTDPRLKSLYKVYSRNNVVMVTGGMMTKELFQSICDFDYDLLYSPKLNLVGDIRKTYHQEAHGFMKPAIFTQAERGIYTLSEESPGYKAAEPIPSISVDSGERSIGMLHADLPYRPIPFHANAGKVAFESRSTTPATVTLTVDDPNFQSNFQIIRTEAGRFFKVEPESGVLAYGKPVTLTVSVNQAEITSARLNAGAFLIRLPNGLSRPVSVYVDSRGDDKLLAKDRAKVIPGNITTTNAGEAQITVDVPKDGIYFMFARLVKEPNLLVSIDGGEKTKMLLSGRQHRDEERWRSLGKSALTSQAINFTAGKHTITLQGLKGTIGGFALAQTPEELLLAPTRP